MVGDGSGGSGICQRGDHGERVEHEPKRGSGAEPGGGAPNGVQGQSSWWGSVG